MRPHDRAQQTNTRREAMLSSVQQVNEEFFRLFHGLTIGGIIVPSRYAKKSSKDYTEEQENQVYPCIAIQDFVPVIRDGGYVNQQEFVGGLNAEGTKANVYHRPTWMSFRYDVSIASKSYHKFMEMRQYFTEHFVNEVRFIFNKQIVGDEEVGDIVPYKVDATDIPRNDGVFETNYSFDLSVWLYAVPPKEVDVIQQVNITCTEQEPPITDIRVNVEQ